MSNRRLLVAIAVVVTTATVPAQSARQVDRAIDNRFTFGAAPQTKTRIILPSDNKGVTGLGRMSEVTAHANVTGSFITNAKYGSGGVLRPFVSNITIKGGRPAPDFDHPPGHPDQRPVIADAVALDGSDCWITDCVIQSFDGMGIQGQHSALGTGIDADAVQINRNLITHCFTGIKANNSDTRLHGNVVAACRDYGLWITNNAGNVQSNHNHFYGHYAAIHNENGLGYSSTQDEFSDARYGYLGGQAAHNARFTNPTSIHCNVRNMWLRAPTHITNPVIEVWKNGSVWSDKVGVEITGPRCTILGGHIDMNWTENPRETATGAATAAVKMGREDAEPTWGADDCVIETRIHGRPDVTNEKGIWVTGPIAGGRFELFVYGFSDSGDAAVVVDAAAAASKGTTWIIRGPTQNFITFPQDIDKSNTITTIDSTTGETKQLWP
jgi:Right handed beta helix region